ncbi:hypothetical protein [Bradyrhizobium liaoningense]
MSGCGHGKTFKEPCIECQLVLAREGLAWAIKRVEKYSKFIADLAPEAGSEPWIEYGACWAKVHFPRDVTDQDRAALAVALSHLSHVSQPATEECTQISDRRP